MVDVASVTDKTAMVDVASVTDKTAMVVVARDTHRAHSTSHRDSVAVMRPCDTLWPVLLTYWRRGSTAVARPCDVL